MTAVGELELDLDAFEGPFDLLLTLLLKEELEPAEIDMAAIVIAFVERLAEREELDLEACGEFLVLISALLELKARSLFPDEEAELADLEPEEAAEELARRLAEYRRMKQAAGWLAERLTSLGHEVTHMLSVDDEDERIVEALRGLALKYVHSRLKLKSMQSQVCKFHSQDHVHVEQAKHQMI